MDERKEEEPVREANRKLTRQEVMGFIQILSNLQPIVNGLESQYEKRKMIEKLLELL